MSTPKAYLPHEATTEYMLQKEIEELGQLQNFLEELSPDEQQRFIQFAHHLVYLGFQEGLKRPTAGPTDEQRANALGKEASIYLLGSDDEKRRRLFGDDL